MTSHWDEIVPIVPVPVVPGCSGNSCTRMAGKPRALVTRWPVKLLLLLLLLLLVLLLLALRGSSV